MKSRCYNPKAPNYSYYWGRGIVICEEWLNREKITIGKHIHNHSKGWISFQEWALKNGYADNLTIDRIDTNKGYSPENCRWVPMKAQINNTRSNRLIVYKGRTQTMKQWCEELKLNYRTVISRFRRGWSIEKAFEHR
jgi:hypothetical protein